MKHIDEHILELYILRDEKTLRKKVSIEKHLRECAGCRELAEKIQTLYADVEQELAQMESTSNNPQVESISKMGSTLPARIQETTSELWHKPNLPVSANWRPIQKWTPIALQKFWFKIGNFVYQKPVTATVGSLVFLGALLFFVNLGLEKTFKDDNPSYYRYSPESKLEVYNKENKLLWSAQCNNLINVKNIEASQNIQFTKVTDIDNDGINEIVTTLNMLNQKKGDHLINIFDNSGILLKSVPFENAKITFRGAQYIENIYLGNLFSQIMTDGTTNFFVNVNTGRSPDFVTRMDPQFNIIGQYWHFGNFQTIYPSDIFNDGKKKIILLGKNDVDDMNLEDFPSMVVLDPEKLHETEESSVTTGFGFNRSNSELYYIRFPETDMEKSLRLKSTARSVVNDNNDILQVNVNTGNPEPNSSFIGFDYIFSKKDMTVLDVKFTSEAERTHNRLKKEGKIKSTFNREYLNKLKNNVEYWNGEKWVKEPTMISPPMRTLGAR